MLSSKISMDDTYSNASWTIVGGSFFVLREVNQMERELFAFLDFNAVVKKGELDVYVDGAETRWEAFRFRRTAPFGLFTPATTPESEQRKRRRSDTCSSRDSCMDAQTLRHKRAADAALALLRPSSDQTARFKTSQKHQSRRSSCACVESASEASSSSSSSSGSDSSPESICSDHLYRSSGTFSNFSSAGASPSTPGSPLSGDSSHGPPTPENEGVDRFRHARKLSNDKLSCGPTDAAFVDKLPASFIYAAGGRTAAV